MNGTLRRRDRSRTGALELSAGGGRLAWEVSMHARGRLSIQWPAAAACLASAALALAQGYQDAKLVPDDAAAGIEFGRAASAGDNVVAVGARFESSAGSRAGAVYIFMRDVNGWFQDAKLTASDAAPYDEFGYAVSVSDDLLIVGAPFDNAVGTDSGSAYVFRQAEPGWVEEAKLVPSDGQGLDRFGQAVAVSGDWLLVGAPLDDDAGSDSGSAYLFRHDGTAWVEHAKLKAGGGMSGGQFGGAVALDGDIALVGAPQEDAGAAYVYHYDEKNWIEEARIVASDGSSNDRFGAAVAVRDGVLLVGAPRYDSTLGLNIGAAYVFQRDDVSWVEVALLTASDAAPNDYLGGAVAVDGGCAVVGAHFSDAVGVNSGAAYVYRADGDAWAEEAKLTAADGGPFDWFGAAVALASDRVVVGANRNDEAGEDCGAAYVFTLVEQNEPPTCDAGGDYEVECQNGGASLSLDGTGSSDPDEDALTYHWTIDCPDAFLDDPNSPTPVLSFSVVSPCQTECTVTLAVSDGVNPPVSCDALVAVVDTTPPTIACPPDVEIIAGEASDPNATGIAEFDDCDPNVELAYWDAEFLSECLADAVFKTVARTWIATDGCGNSSSCEQTITVRKLVLPLDIKPGACPNTYNPRGNGYLRVAILGTPDLDAGHIDLASIQLSRGDCVGGWVLPNEGPPGPGTAIRDVGTPLGVDPCACHSDELDGFDDLVLQFSSAALDDALDLSSYEPGVVVEIVVSGEVLAPGTPSDGAPFIAVDCLQLVGGGRGRGR